MKIKKLIGKTVLVCIPEKTKRMTESGLHLPDTIPNATGIVEADVLYVGSGLTVSKTGDLRVEEALVKPGDKVLVNAQFGTPMKVEDKMCRLYNYDDIIALLS